MSQLPRLQDGRAYYDISPELSPELAVFPGDTPFERRVVVGFDDGVNYVVSSIHGSVHLGAHVDAPNHYARGAEGIDKRSLNYYLGECQVISIDLPRGSRILPKHLEKTTIRASRVLFKTGSYPNANRWNGDFNALSPELIRMLSDRGVILVGIDTPSIDLADDKILETHQIVHEKNLAVLEGIVLQGVPDGIYQLVALPLKIRDGDASPVRAILIGERS